MTGDAALMVLNPREIPDCMDAIKGLGIPTFWASYMTEADAAAAINEAIAGSDFGRYVVLSDDTIPTREALDAVLALHADGFPAVTGWCNLDSVLPHVNLTRNELPPPPPAVTSYDLLTLDEARSYEGLIPTTFVGLALTCLGRDLWLDHPLEVSALGGQMDYVLSHRLQEAGVPIVAPTDGFIWHVKETWNRRDRAPEKRLLVGHRPAAVSWT